MEDELKRLNETLLRIEKKLDEILIQRKRVFDMDEAAAYCGFTTRVFSDYFRGGKIPGGSKPTGHKVFFDRNVLDDWLLSNPIKTKKQIESEAALYIHVNRKRRGAIDA